MSSDNAITEEERQHLLLAYIEGSGARGATKAELRDWLHYCEMAALNMTMIELIMIGEVLPYRNERGDYIFTQKGSTN